MNLIQEYIELLGWIDNEFDWQFRKYRSTQAR